MLDLRQSILIEEFESALQASIKELEKTSTMSKQETYFHDRLNAYQ